MDRTSPGPPGPGPPTHRRAAGCSKRQIEGRHTSSGRTDMGIDYGREFSFGVFPSPLAEPEAMKRVWGVIDAAERGGLDLVGIQDHPYQRRQLDTWSLMAAALARTEQIRVFPD